MLSHLPYTLSLLGLCVLLAIPNAQAQVVREPISAASAALLRWQQSNRELVKLRAQHDGLAHRIAALKRLRGPRPANRKLQELLQKSIIAAKEMEQKSQVRAQHASLCRDTIRAGRAEIDRQIALRKSGLRSREAKVRQETARILRRLLGERANLRAMQEQLNAHDAVPEPWQQYEVKIDALDGPLDLREKAEFIEDTRDKLHRKKKKLSELLTEKQQILVLARASYQFQSDMSAFDESTRSGRVERQGERASTLALPRFGASSEADVADSFAAPSNGSGNQSPAASATADRGDDAAASSGGPSVTESTNAPASSASSPGVGTSISGVNQSAGTWVQRLDPDLLINLNINSLFRENLDMAQLRQLMANLEKLDAYLRAQAKNIHDRADRIEADEKQVLRPK